jgi:hypothetical protein
MIPATTAQTELQLQYFLFTEAKSFTLLKKPVMI